MAIIDNPELFADKFRIKSARLINWDYSQSGFYFITICTLNKNKFLGKIVNNQINLSIIGQITRQELIKTFEIRKNIKLDEWTIMPNHIHLIIEIKFENNNVETPQRDVSINFNKKINRTTNATNKWQPNSIGSVICQFKSICTKKIKSKNFFFAWQSRFYDRIIRNQKEYFAIKSYIQNNPKNWQKDIYNISLPT